MTMQTDNLPKEKQTVLGLYVTAKEAYEKWQADPENSQDHRRPHTRGISLRRPSDRGLEDSRLRANV